MGICSVCMCHLVLMGVYGYVELSSGAVRMAGGPR